MQELDASRNNFGAAGAAHIAGGRGGGRHCSPRHPMHLESLLFQFMATFDVASNIYLALARGLAENEALEVLDLTSCQIGGLGVAAIATALLPRAGAGFAEAVKSSPSAASILTAACGGAPSFRQHAGMTPVSATEIVRLGLKLVGSSGGLPKMADDAAGNFSLRELWLGDNNADRRCVFPLVAAMAVHPSLSVIELRTNPLGPAVARRLLR